MIYNMDFLIAAFVFLILILYHFLRRKKLDNANSRIFLFFILTGLADIVLDIISSILIMEGNEAFGLTRLALTGFYLLQVFMMYAMLCYTQSLRDGAAGRIRRTMIVWLIPAAAMGLVIVSNYRNGLLFCFDGSGRYEKGPLYMMMYYYAIVYVGIAAVSSIIYYRELGIEKFGVIWEFLIIAGICVAVQGWCNQLLMTGFGISLGIAVLFLTINNPYGYTDNLTGVFDKTHFGEWIREQMRKGKTLNVITIDIHRLKQLNKVYGTSAGDELLVRIAGKLMEISDTRQIFRVTGNRFLMVTCSLAGYEGTRDQVMKLFGSPFEVNGEQIRLSAIVCGILNGGKLEESDRLLSYIEYLVSLAPNVEETILIQDDNKTMEGFQYEQEVERFLNTAIAEDLFEVWYQPVYSFEAGGFVTMEALSRLYHPSLGPIAPEIFVGIAEKRGQITEIGLLQFRRVCRFIKEHEEIMDSIRNVKFNLSPMELLKQGHSQMLVETIREFGLPFSYFQFEITETVATEYSENFCQAVTDFLKVGIGLCLDDFGSGYANLNTVLKLPFSSIKLDRSLLTGICEDSQIASFYRNIVSILSNMGYVIISEGVETGGELEMLRGWGVDMVQGYYFSKPVDSSEIIEKLYQNGGKNEGKDDNF